MLGVGLLDCTQYVRLEKSPVDYVPQGGSEDCPFIKAVCYVLVRGAPASL